MVIYPLLELTAAWWVLSLCPGLIGALFNSIGRCKTGYLLFLRLSGDTINDKYVVAVIF